MPPHGRGEGLHCSRYALLWHRAASTAETTVCHRLGSAEFPQFHRYYAVIRLLSARRVLSICKTSITLTTCVETVRHPRYACTPLCARHALLTPVGSPQSCLTTGSYCLLLRGKYRLPLFKITGLNRFTLSHCGSRTSLPTLKPCLATRAPRLCTGCPLRLCRGWTFTVLSYTHRTGAPSIL